MGDSYDVVVVGLGALGSSAAMHLARRGLRVLGLERFELGHRRGASHDSSRILRHSYHTPAYVRLTQEAYADWAELERWSGEQLVTVTGGLDLFPPTPAIPMDDYTASLSDVAIPFELLDVAEIGRRWPQFSLPSGTVGLYQERGAIVPAARTTALMQKLAVAAGAELRGSAAGAVAVRQWWPAPGRAGRRHRDRRPGRRVRRRLDQRRAGRPRRPAAAGDDAGAGDVLRAIPPGGFAPHHLPLWIWMDDPSFYGFPCYGEPTVKAAQDCGGPVIDTSDPFSRTSEPDPEMLSRLATFMASLLPESGDPVRSIRCQYTLTPDRDFVLAPVPGHESVLVGLGAAHAFKFAPTFGRILADLAVSGSTSSDIGAFRLDRPALTDPAYQAHWLV